MLIAPARQGDQGGVTEDEVLAKVRCEREPAIPAAEHAAKQHDPVGCKPTQIDVVAAPHARHQS